MPNGYKKPKTRPAGLTFQETDDGCGFLFFFATKWHQAFKTGDAEMVKMVLNHKSAEEDILLQQSSLSKDKKEKKKQKGVSSKPINQKAAAAAGGEGEGEEEGQEGDVGDGPSITHELGFGIGDGVATAVASGGGGGGGSAAQADHADKVDLDDDDEDGERRKKRQRVSFRLRELPIRNPDECFGDDAREDTTGLNLWAAAVVLARWVASPEIVSRLKGKTVLELGAGCGAG